ncbi:Frizzled domain [Plasmopara halstedii]|uniref:Frizzled domain n=1 Tax=Plasmopara halstedii TaxID=4781 RepID=A0A0P1AJI9_PLAHL|nr:Frizzled domain [Plasmopara halstedii]CEG41221.1 Frizzled domain [Plasmopara halstedii]|eukprot:XP_024577590.1 Frizzled domain [Plasmopara halstedii]
MGNGGVCTKPTDFDLLLPFCKAVIPYPACLPRYQSIWYNHSALSKDRFVEQLFHKIVNQRKIDETNVTMADYNTDEWGGPRTITPRFTGNSDCENSLRNYFCWLNFPRCDTEGRSLLLCRSVCENFMTSCQYSKDLWRCGDPEYINGRSAEISTEWVDQKQVYYRAPYPGSPFKDNAFDPNTDKPLIVCTPSLENSAQSDCLFVSRVAILITSVAIQLFYVNHCISQESPKSSSPAFTPLLTSIFSNPDFSAAIFTVVS